MQSPQSPTAKFVPVLTLLLIVGAFFIGSLFTKVRMLEKATGVSAKNGDGQVAGAAASLAPAVLPEAANPVDIDLSDAAFLGKPDAKVAIVEFTDFQCPYCGQQFTNSFSKIKSDYIDTGKIRYYVKDFPLFQIHPFAQKAAEAANCAREQNKYWEMHEKMFNNQQALGLEDLKKTAVGLGMNSTQFNSCLDSGKYAEAIKKSTSLGESVGVRGTPSSFVGTVANDVIHGSIISGAVPYETFKAALNKLL